MQDLSHTGGQEALKRANLHILRAQRSPWHGPSCRFSDLTPQPDIVPIANSCRTLARVGSEVGYKSDALLVTRHAAINLLRPGFNSTFHIEHLSEAQTTEMFCRLSTGYAVMTEEGQWLILRQCLQGCHRVFVEHLMWMGKPCKGAVRIRSHVNDSDVVASNPLSERLDRQRLHRRRRIRVADRQTCPAHIFHPVNFESARAWRAGEIEVHADALRFRNNLLARRRLQLELRVETTIDPQMQHQGGIVVLHRRTNGVRCGGGDVNLWRRAVRRRDTKQGVQLTGIQHRLDDVTAADQLALDVELRDRRPIAVELDALANVGIRQHIDRVECIDDRRQGTHRFGRKSAARRARRAFHEQHHAMLIQQRIDTGTQNRVKRHRKVQIMMEVTV